MIDHDRLFKELLMTFFIEFVQLFLPELAAYLDKRSLVFLDKEIFTDVTSGERHEVDVVARARFRGQQLCFLVHVENQAQKQADFNRRMFSYLARLHEKYRLPVYPIALFSHGSSVQEPDSYKVVFPDRDVLRFRFRVIQLKRLRWRAFLRQPNPVASALMAKMGFKPQERVQVKIECLRLLARSKLSRARERLISGFIDTYLRLNKKEALQFNQKVATLSNSSERTRIMELTTSWKEEGRQEGRREGRQEGRQEGGEQIILRLLRRRWGTLPPALERKVRVLSLKQLESLAESILDFSSPAEVEAWLDRQ